MVAQTVKIKNHNRITLAIRKLRSSAMRIALALYAILKRTTQKVET